MKESMPPFPMRINKYLAHKKYATRRGADELIEKERVLINGAVAKLGDKVNEKDLVEVRTSPGEKSAERVYLAYHKPVGVVTNSSKETEDPKRKKNGSSKESSKEGAQESIADILQYKKHKLFPIGRLDKDTHGLMILTNDGRITDRMLNPAHQHEKEYQVTVDKHFSPSLLAAIEREEGAKAEALDDRQFKVILTQSNPQLRAICGKFNFAVTDLVRSRILNIKLNSLKEGSHREIAGAELKTFLTSLGL